MMEENTPFSLPINIQEAAVSIQTPALHFFHSKISNRNPTLQMLVFLEGGDGEYLFTSSTYSERGKGSKGKRLGMGLETGVLIVISDGSLWVFGFVLC